MFKSLLSTGTKCTIN